MAKKVFFAVVVIMITMAIAGCGNAPQKANGNGGGYRIVVRPKNAKVLPPSPELTIPSAGQSVQQVQQSACGEEDPRGQRIVENYEANCAIIDAADQSGFWQEVDEKVAYARAARRQHMGY